MRKAERKRKENIMLKGKSKIELFDAATGARLLEQHDSNLVTDALGIIANCKDKTGLLRWWIPGSPSNSTGIGEYGEYLTGCPARAMMPLYKRALGGVLLWDGNIAEDPSVVIPPAGIGEVGHAGGEYGGENIYRGSYNTNESGEISGGYRHVWDFDTDKANGVIKCLSLTSFHGGNVGYHGCYDTAAFPMYNRGYFYGNENRYDDASAFGRIAFKGDTETTARMFYIRKMEDGSLRVYRRNGTEVWYLKAPDPAKVSLSVNQITCTDRVTLPVTPIDSRSCIYVYKGQIHEVAKTAVTRLRHRIFSLDGEQLSDKTVNLSFNMSSGSYYNPAVYRDGYYYCFTHIDTDVVKADENGNEISRIPILKVITDEVWSITVNEFNGEILFAINVQGSGSSATHIPYTLNSKDVLSTLGCNSFSPVVAHLNSPMYSQYVQTDDPCSPFLFFSDGYFCSIIPVVNVGYLATINNLQSPITKTSAQTMKITYEIYDE